MAEQCLSSMLLSILTSNFGVIFAFWVLNGLFWASIFMLPLIMGRFCFGASMGYFGGWVKAQKLFWGLFI